MSDSRNTSDTGDRKVVADDLYIDRGPGEASSRCDSNTKFAKVDLCEEMMKRLNLQPGETVVDVGCGAGQHLVRFAEAVGQGGVAKGYDFSPAAVEKTRARGGDADVASGDELPVADDFADAVSSSFAVYYLADAAKTMAEWCRVVKPGGRIVVSGPADDTNAELYDFHRAVTGKGPADVDLLSLGYVADRLPPELEKLGCKDVKCEVMTNPITYPTHDDFVDYWVKTSLFARGVAEDEREATIAKGREELKNRPEPFVITKRVSILSAVR